MFKTVKLFIYRKTAKLRTAIWHEQKAHIVQPIYRFIRFCVLFTVNSVYRNDRITQFKYRKYIHQPNSYTSENRYPELFVICQEYFVKMPNIKVLSFGCSSGKEVFALNEYLPLAKIVGVDINIYCLKQGIASNKNPNNLFLHSRSVDYLSSNDYDAIFCLAVLQHPHNRLNNPRIALKFTFNQFEDQIIQLDRKLKIGGLLFIDNCDFNFIETNISNKYTPLNVEKNKITRDRPLYNAQNQLLSGQTNLYRVFIKNT